MSILEKIFPCLTREAAQKEASVNAQPDQAAVTIEPERGDDKLPKLNLYDIPTIVDLPIDVRTQGKYKTRTGWARGCVVHYTAGRSLRGRVDAENTLRHLASSGLGCLVMDINGIIYKARNQSLSDVAWHAGTSAWLGLTGISQYCIGMEICNAGQLDNFGKSWFGEQYTEAQIRRIDAPKDNHKRGLWHKMTEAQEKSLVDFLLWQADVNPEFKLDWIIGHDECATPLGRKSDPGASLSVTMPELRSLIAQKISLKP